MGNILLFGLCQLCPLGLFANVYENWKRIGKHIRDLSVEMLLRYVYVNTNISSELIFWRVEWIAFAGSSKP